MFRSPRKAWRAMMSYTCPACGQVDGDRTHHVCAALTCHYCQVRCVSAYHVANCEAEVQSGRKLPLEYRDELIRGTKYATLWSSAGSGSRGKPEFAGSGYTRIRYGAEAYSVCGIGNSDHDAPDKDCTCGFWIACHPSSRLSQWDCTDVSLEVEFGGRVLECGKNHEVWGHRAQWQRVLSVSLSPVCGVPDDSFTPYSASVASLTVMCQEKARHLVRWPSTGAVRTACAGHAGLAAAGGYTDGRGVIRKPVTWLREGLQTEIRPGTVTDVAPKLVKAPAGPSGLLVPSDISMAELTSMWSASAWPLPRHSATWYFPPATVRQMPDPPHGPNARNVQWEWSQDYIGAMTFTCTWEE